MRDEAPLLPRDAAAAQRQTCLSRGFGALVAATFALIVLGALVRAHGAGLACPDWPLCFGEVVPRFDFHVAFEWTHRVLAGSVALAFVGLAAAALRAGETRARVGRWLGAAAALLAGQIVLGALTVWLGLARWTVVAHLLTGNAFAATLLVTALRLRRAARPRETPALATGARALVTVAACAVVAQVALGGLVSSSYAGLACPSWPRCDDRAWFPSLQGGIGLHLAHRTGAYLALSVLAAAALSVRRPPALARALAAALGLAFAQTLVGIANVWLRLPVEVTALHSALAAALVLTLGFAAHEAWTARAEPAARRERDPQATRARSAAPRRA